MLPAHVKHDLLTCASLCHDHKWDPLESIPTTPEGHVFCVMSRRVKEKKNRKMGDYSN